MACLWCQKQFIDHTLKEIILCSEWIMEQPTVMEYFKSGEVCPIPFIDDETIEVVNMIDMTSRISPDKYWDMPAVLLDVMKIVNGERGRLAKLRMPKGGNKK